MWCRSAATRAPRVTAGERVDNRQVLLALGFQARLPVAVTQMNACDLNMRIQALVHLYETPAAGKRNDPLMKLDVAGGMGEPSVFSFHRRDDLVNQKTKLRNVLGCRATEGLLRRQTFQGASDVERLCNVGGRHGCDEGSAPGPYLDQGLGFEASQGIFDRGEAYAELSRKFVNVQALTGSEFSRQDCIAEGFVDRIARTLPRNHGKTGNGHGADHTAETV